jgi:hypothetical protein
MVAGKPARRRRLVKWEHLDPRGGRRRFVFGDGTRAEVTPIGFVCACEKGHLQDIEWKWVVHGGQTCHEPKWVEEKGTSADPADSQSFAAAVNNYLFGNCSFPDAWEIAAASGLGFLIGTWRVATRNSSCSRERRRTPNSAGLRCYLAPECGRMS